MKQRPKALIAWSSGKDSAWALHVVRKTGNFDIVGALTTVNDTFHRVAMHGVREQLLETQLSAVGLEPIIVRIPYPCNNEIYELEMTKTMTDAKARGISHVIFGDLFLEDIRTYRESKLSEIGVTAIFPLWKRPTHKLAKEMIDAGVEACLVTIDLNKLPVHFAGRRFDTTLLSMLPTEIDPCGENGEFHSFVSAGPMLSHKIAIRIGEIIERDGFAYADLLTA